MIRTVQIGKYKLYADDGSEMPEEIRDLTGLKILQNGVNFEKHVYNEIRRLLPDCRGFLDVGANVGLYTIAVRDLHPTVPIVAIEASQKNTQLLMRSIVENGIEGVTVINHPVADRPRIICVDRHNKINVTCSANMESGDHWEYAQALSVDYFWAGHRDLVKIDIEGFEYLALLGMGNHIVHSRPRIIFEYCPQIACRSGLTDPVDLLRHFTDIGYSLTVLDYIPNIRKTFHDAQECHDYVVKTTQWIGDILAEPI